jgi:hypothetical protein
MFLGHGNVAIVVAKYDKNIVTIINGVKQVVGV